MKRNIILSLGVIVGLGALISMAWIGVGMAVDLRTGDKPVLASGETTDNSLYMAGNLVKINGTVKGDVFCAGQDIEVTGAVEGDIMCAGQKVRITGTINGDVRVVGQKVDIEAAITGSLSAFGEDIVVKKDARIGRDFTFGASTVVIEGRVERDVLGGAEAVRVASHIGRNLDGDISTLFLDSNAHVAGNLTYQGRSAAQLNQGAVVEGETKYTPTQDNSPQGFQSVLWFAFYSFLATMLIGIAAILLAPKAFDTVGAAVSKRPLISFAGGAASIILVPLLSFGLIASLFGLPLALLLIMALSASVMGSIAITSYGIGSLVVQKLDWPTRGRRIASLVLGSGLLFLVSMIPVAGILLLAVAVIVGVGALVVAVGTRMYPKKNKAK